MKTLLYLSLLPLLFVGCKPVKKIYSRESSVLLQQPTSKGGRVITEADLEALPLPVRNYLRLSGCIGQPFYMKGEFRFTGTFRMGKSHGWMKVSTMQVNDYEAMTRVFYMNARMMGLFSAKGRDLYKDGKGNMLIKLASLFTLFDVKGPEMDQGALVTVLNDLTLVPTAMLSPKVEWEAIDSLSARASISDHGISVSGVFIFDEDGYIKDFYTDDRYQVDKEGAKKLRWSTPFRDYKSFGAFVLPGYGSGVWHDEDGPFEYARFTLTEHRLF